MKATVNKNELLPVLAKIQGLTGRKTNLAITTNILMKTEDASISISATDLETGFEGIYAAHVETQGTIAINARKLYEIVRDFPSEDICVNEIENHWIEIGNQNVEYHIVGLNPEDFPEIPQIPEVDFFEIDSDAFGKMIDRTVMVSGPSDDNRAHILGVYAERMDQNDLPAGPNILIPKKGLVEVAKFLDTQSTVKIGIKDNNFIVKKERETLIIRLLEGDFPQYGDIVLKTDGHDIQMDRQLFLMMLKRMSILSSDEYKGVIFHFSKDKLMINSTNPDIGESKEDMEIIYPGDALEVMYNPKFFIDTLSVMNEDNVILNITDEEKPCKIEGEKDKSFLSVIMPMRI